MVPLEQISQAMAKNRDKKIAVRDLPSICRLFDR